MARYLISFPASAMHVSDQDMAAVSEEARAVIREAKDAGVYVFGGGMWVSRMNAISRRTSAAAAPAEGPTVPEFASGPPVARADFPLEHARSPPRPPAPSQLDGSS